VIGAVARRGLLRRPICLRPDPAVVVEIQAYLTVCCRRAFIETSPESIAVHSEQAAEADLFAEAWEEWTAAGSTEAEIPAGGLSVGRGKIQASRRNSIMALRSKIVLKSDLSQETLTALRSYLRQFLDGRHMLEHFDGSLSIYLHDLVDVRLVRGQFPSPIVDVRHVG
jgi:hypothetical protein